MQQSDTSAFLGKEKLFPLLLRMSIPAIIGMMVGAFYNIADTIFLGRGAGPMAIAGLAVAFPIQMIVPALAKMIGVGGASIISRRLGERNHAGAASALGTAFSSGITIALVLTASIAVFTIPILKLFGATETILPYSTEYLRTVLWGLPFIAFSMMGNDLIRSEGKAKTAMGTMLIGMILNIILDPIFIFGFGMGIRGAALATVIAQCCSFLWVLLFYLGKRSNVALERRYLGINLPQLGEMILLGLPNAVQMAGMSVLTAVINNTLGTMGGDMAITTFGMIHRLLSFVFMPILGLAQGFQPIAGYNYGAKDYSRVKHILLLTALSAVVLALGFYVCIRLFPQNLIGMFTTDTELISFAARALMIMSTVMPVIGLQIVSSVYFQAIGKGMYALLLGLSRQFLFLIPSVLILPRFYGLHGVWASFPVSDFLSTAIAITAVVLEIRHLKGRYSAAMQPAHSEDV